MQLSLAVNRVRLNQLHKYLYCGGDPINGTDPTGMFTINEQMVMTGIRVGLFALNLYGLGTNSFKAARDSVYSWNEFSRGNLVRGLAYAASAIFHTGMAALNALGCRSFIKNPPNFSGGLSFAVNDGAIEVFWQQIVVANPAVAKWALTEALPAVLAVFSSRWDTPSKLPARSQGGKTSGSLRDRKSVV
jgi:hypothetical protein